MKITVEFEFDKTWLEQENDEAESIMDFAIEGLTSGVTYKVINKIKSGEISCECDK